MCFFPPYAFQRSACITSKYQKETVLSIQKFTKVCLVGWKVERGEKWIDRNIFFLSIGVLGWKDGKVERKSNIFPSIAW